MAETTTETRQPTMEQKRSIMALLLECYDTERQLYRGSETDITLAETVGGGCMWGWVAKIREDNFGAGCGNEAAGDMSADVAAYRSSVMQAQRDAEAAVARIEALAAEARKVMQEAAIPFADLRAKGDALLAKMNALTKAFGPKVERAVK